jgi:replication factor C large subunit
MSLSHKKPSKVSDLLGNTEAFAAAREWASSWQQGKPQKPLMVCGPPGTGKTALAYALASEFSWELFEFNASDLRDEGAVGALLANASSTGSLFGGRRLILIDDADALSGRNDRGGAGAMAAVLSDAKQPVLLTALDYYDKKLQTIRTYCQRLELRRVHQATIAKLLRYLAHEGGSGLSQEHLEKIAVGAGGDVRAALNDLQGNNIFSSRDSQQNVFEVLRTILKSEKYSEARKAAFSSEVEHDTLKLWVAHNIPLEYEKPFDIAEAYGALSRADIFDGRITRGQHYGYLRYSNDLLSSGVALAKSAPYRKYTPLGFPDYLREMGASKGNRATRRAVLKKISAACHCSPSSAGPYLQFLEVLAKSQPAALAEEFGFEEEELAFVSKVAPKKEKPPKKAGAAKAARPKKKE